jgi:hypothetical protein
MTQLTTTNDDIAAFLEDDALLDEVIQFRALSYADLIKQGETHDQATGNSKAEMYAAYPISQALMLHAMGPASSPFASAARVFQGRMGKAIRQVKTREMSPGRMPELPFGVPTNGKKYTEGYVRADDGRGRIKPTESLLAYLRANPVQPGDELCLGNIKFLSWLSGHADNTWSMIFTQTERFNALIRAGYRIEVVNSNHKEFTVRFKDVPISEEERQRQKREAEAALAQVLAQVESIQEQLRRLS